MLDARGPLLPHAWISGDDELGRCSWFRQELRSRDECYLLAVPSNTSVRDLTAAEPPYAGHGRRPRVPFTRVDRWCAAFPETAWQTIEVGPGEKGPVTVQVVARVGTGRHAEGRASDVTELLVVFRERQGDGTWKHDYLLSNGPLTTPLPEFARVFKAQHRVEECLQRAKGEAGLADYEVRTWRGWYHHQALALTATWFLTVEARRGKKMDAGADGVAVTGVDRRRARAPLGNEALGVPPAYGKPTLTPDRGSTLIPLESTQPFAPLENTSTGITASVELIACFVSGSIWKNTTAWRPHTSPSP